MEAILFDTCILAMEFIANMFICKSFLDKKYKELKFPILLTIAATLATMAFSELFQNIFGWFMVFPILTIAIYAIFKVNIRTALAAMLFSYSSTTILELILLLSLPPTLSSINDSAIQVIGTGAHMIISIFLSLLPLNNLYNKISGGKLAIKILLSYIALLVILSVAITKINISNSLQVLPVIAVFIVITLITNILILMQQQTIEFQNATLNSYATYEHMAKELINDIRAKQHDFNNQLNAVKMLPYTHKDYDSLSHALTNYSTTLVDEYNEAELLRINLPVVAGFIFSKIKEAEKADKKLNIVVKNPVLHSVVPEYDIIRILGILIDNAIEAIGVGETASVHLDSSDNKITIVTLNPGNEITPELQYKMFTRGYTTKTTTNSSEKHGYGLSNLMVLTNKYNGKIFLENHNFSSKNQIRFEITV